MTERNEIMNEPDELERALANWLAAVQAWADAVTQTIERLK